MFDIVYDQIGYFPQLPYDFLRFFNWPICA